MIFGGRQWSVMSLLSPTQCAERLGSEVDSVFGLGGKLPLVGRVTPSVAVFRRRFSSRNVFQAELTARFQPEGEGTRIYCRVGMSKPAAIFSMVWLGYVLLVAIGLGLLIVTGNLRPAPGMPEPTMAAVPLVMAGFAAAMVVLGRRLVLREARVLGLFLADRLDVASVDGE